MSVRPSEVCDFFSENVPKINKKRDFYDMSAKYPFHRVKLLAFPKKLLAFPNKAFGFPQKAFGFPKKFRGGANFFLAQSKILGCFGPYSYN
jgi:hypothetical protein